MGTTIMTKINYTLKPVTQEVLKEVVEMLVDGYAEEYPTMHKYKFDVCYVSLLSFIGKRDIIFNYISNEQDIMGAFCANIYTHPFSGLKTCNELFWYVKKEFRNMSLGNASLSQLEEWAIKENCSVLDVSCPDAENNKELKRFLLGKKFKIQNTNMIKYLFKEN